MPRPFSCFQTQILLLTLCGTEDNSADADRHAKYKSTVHCVDMAPQATMKVFNRLSTSANLSWLAVVLIFYGLGISIAIRQAPFHMPDEGAHYLRAYEVSKLHLINLPNSVGVDMPCGEYAVVAAKYYPIAFMQKNAVDAQADLACKVRTVSTAGSYSFVPYIPAALALAIIEKFNLTTEGKLAAARIANFSVWFSVLFFSLLLLKGGRVLMGCLILMPSFFWQLVALSADGATVASCLAYVCFVLRIAQRKLHLTRGVIKVLIALAVFIGASKGVYAPVALLAFGLWERLPSKSWLYKLCVLSCPTLAALGIFLAQAALSDPHLVYLGNNANPTLQLSYVAQNPMTFIYLMTQSVSRTEITSLVAPGYAVPNSGRGFGITIVSLGTIAILMACTDFGINKKFRLVSGLLVFVVLSGVCLPLYLTYSPVKFDSILGLQGRYYLPILPLLFITFAFNASNVNWVGFFNQLEKRIHWLMLMSALGLIVAIVNIR